MLYMRRISFTSTQNACITALMEAQFDSDKLKKLIEETGYRSDHIAENLGIKKTSLRAIVVGRSRPSLPLIKLMSVFFKIPESDFYKQAA